MLFIAHGWSSNRQVDAEAVWERAQDNQEKMKDWAIRRVRELLAIMPRPRDQRRPETTETQTKVIDEDNGTD